MSAMLPVHERFFTWQGEGEHMGRSAFFIRLFGCPLHCPWCDSAGTWHKDYVPKEIKRIHVNDLAVEAKESKASIVVVTGGEPAIHDLRQLTTELSDMGIPVHLETSGAFPIKGAFDWITVSPKKSQHPLLESLESADEIKLIVEDLESLSYWLPLIGPCVARGKTIWLHPEWSQRNNSDILNLITNAVKAYGDPFRAGYQLHKLYRPDSLDFRSAQLAPLGGNPSLGY